MTRIDFHSNVVHPLPYVCRLVRKAYAGQAKIVITAPTDELAKLDEALWTFSQIDFIPHCYANSQYATHTPIILATEAELGALPHYQVLINLSEHTPTLFARFERLLEIINATEAARVAGRARYRFYRERGYLLQTFNQTGVV